MHPLLSKACYNERNDSGGIYMRTCDECGTEFTPKRAGVRYCGRSCAGRATARARGQSGKVDCICAACGKQWQDYASNGRRFCSDECSRAARRTDRPRCEVCGEPVRLMRNRYCSKSCANAARPRPGIASFTGFYARAQAANPNPEPCADCGKPGRHRHHEDYSRPEDVVWLCPSCHRRRHPRKIRIRPAGILLR